MKEDSFYLIRKGSKPADDLTEIVVPYQAQDAKTLERLRGAQNYIVPTGWLGTPYRLGGRPLTFESRESGLDIVIYPHIIVRGVCGTEGAKTAVNRLARGYDEQAHVIRLAIDGHFKQVFGLRSDENRLGEILDESGSRYLETKDHFRRELGLEIDWHFTAGSEIRSWMASLSQSDTQRETLKFNEEMLEAKVEMTISLKIERDDPSRLHRLIGRRAIGHSVDDEIKQIFKRVKEITEPAFRSQLTGFNALNAQLMQELARDGFHQVVTNRIAEEFGYVVHFGDFDIKLNEAKLLALKEVGWSQDDSDHLKKLRETRSNVRAARLDIIGKAGPNSQRMKDLDNTLAFLEGEIREAEVARVDSSTEMISRLAIAQGGDLEQVRVGFLKALEDKSS